MVDGSGLRPVVLNWNVLEAPGKHGALQRHKPSISGGAMDDCDIVARLLCRTSQMVSGSVSKYWTL
jgi:hypothetical protein